MNTSTPLWFIVTFAIAVAALKTWGCPDPQRARQILEDEGYQEIEPASSGGHGWSCGRDNSATAFKAKRGERSVRGVVCCGTLLTCTTRIHLSVTKGPP